MSIVIALRRRERLTLSDATSTVAHLNPRLWIIQYTSLVRPHLEYAVAAWDPHTKRDIAELEKVQRRAARFAKSDYRRTTSVTELLSDLRWEPLSLRRKNTRLAMLFKATHGLSAVPLDGLCRPVRNTRSSKSTTFVRLPSRTDSYKNSFFPRTVADWNSLSDFARSRSSVDAFRDALSSDLAQPPGCC